ncbi:tetratricopeptide repeat protein [candidate division KSB1 bacterium]|nr:tetratricopeptide repeat protein [candidate division KSB1 bacterium]
MLEQSVLVLDIFPELFFEDIRIEQIDDAYSRPGVFVDISGSDSSACCPDFFFAFNNRGISYYRKGQFDRAIEDFDEALRLNPDLAEAFSNRGNVYRKKGQFDRAIEDYEKAINLKPDDGQVFANRGLAYEKKGKPSQALRDFKKAYALGYFHPLLLRKLNESRAIP